MSVLAHENCSLFSPFLSVNALLSRTTVRGRGAYRIGSADDREVSLVLASHWSILRALGTVEEVTGS